MDDNTFDKFIKEKLDPYEDSSFDSSALTDFHERMDSYSPVAWYVKYRTELMVAAALIIFTLVNAYIYKSGMLKQEKNSEVTNNQIQDHTQLIDSLTTVIQQLKDGQKTDVYVIDPSTQHQTDINSTGRVKIASFQSWQRAEGDEKAYTLLLGNSTDIPTHVLKVLQDEQMLSTKDGQLYLVVSENRRRWIDSENRMDQKVLAELHPIIQVKGISLEGKEMKISKSLHEAPVSAKIRKALDQKYYAGIGINVAPHADLMQGIFSSGKGAVTPRVGITVDWIVSPRLSLETSVDYATTKFAIHDDFDCINLSDRERPYGPLQNVSVVTKTVSTPISFKYRDWITANSQAIFKVGYTPYFSLQHQYQYSYEYKSAYDHEETINEVERKNERTFYGGTVTASAGILHAVRKKTRFETSLFYEHSLGTMGSNEKQRMQLVGLRAAYWFKLR